MVLLAAVVSMGCNRNKQEAVLLAIEGDKAVRMDPSAAVSSYEQALALDPTNHHIRYKLAKAFKKKKEWAKVASTLAQATESAPTYANYWKERGYALEMIARDKKSEKSAAYKESIEPYKKCVEHDPNMAECYHRLGISYLWSDDEQQALQYFTKALEIRPDRLDHYFPLALLYLNLGYLDQAEKALTAAVQMSKVERKIPKLDDEKKQKVANRLALIQQAADKKHLYDVHTLRGRLYRDRDDIEKMVKAFEAAEAADKSDPASLFNLGMAYGNLKPPKKDQALQKLKGFTSRACRSKKAALYKTQCEQAQTMTQRLRGPGT
jgi:tetratricopeptide (TPR) repeat protein